MTPSAIIVAPVIAAAVRLLRRVFPASTRARIRLFLFEWLDLSWRLPCGISIRIASYTEWVIYNEIFVSGEYDDALAAALDARSDPSVPLQVLDLGAHVGFFTLRVADWIRRHDPAATLRVTAIEGHPARAREFRRRVHTANRLTSEVTLVEGLVGERSGTTALFDDTLVSTPGRQQVAARYVDLSAVVADCQRIDLLKCDVEGSELRVLENYPDVFAKAHAVVFELHRNLCDVDRCRRLIDEYGFVHARVVREEGPYLIYFASRTPLP